MLTVILLSVYMRLINSNETIVDALRADAIEYYAYALHIKNFGIYSRQNPTKTFDKNVSELTMVLIAFFSTEIF